MNIPSIWGPGHFFNVLWLVLFLVVRSPQEVRAEQSTEGGYAALPLGVRIPFCILTTVLAAFYCGLTLGLLGINTTALEIIAEAGPEPDRTNARRILPFRRLGHQMLVTLILGNMLAAVLTSQLIAAIVNSSELVNFIVGTLVILIFGEILPMSFCNKGGNVLLVGGKAIPALKVSLWLLYPVAKPLGMLLDCIVEHEAGQIYDRNELKKLISVHCDKYSEKSGIDAELLRMMLRVLELDERTAGTIMTPLEDTFMLEGNMVLDHGLLRILWNIGKSRLPVYTGERSCIVGILYVKDMLNFFLLDRKVTTVYDFVMDQGHDMVVVDANLRLKEILGMFKHGVPHLLLVSDSTAVSDQALGESSQKISPHENSCISEASRDVGSPKDEKSRSRFIGILTLEDVIEELIASEIYDEDEYREMIPNPESEAEKSCISTQPCVPPIHKMHVHFYSYGVEDADSPGGRLDKPLSEDQKWVLADYLTRMYIAFAPLSVMCVKSLIDYVGNRIIHVDEDTPPRDLETTGRLLYREGVPTNVFTLLLGGTVQLLVGEKFTTELYSFSSFAEEALLSDESFVSNCTVMITRSSRILQISRDDLHMANSIFDEKKGNKREVLLPIDGTVM